METTDLGLAAYIYSQGKDIEIYRIDQQHCVFCFEDCEDVRAW